ncbi:Fc receptor-like protein 5 [Mixophyes fleayi]|uniref:Fc receptor-like protein 5 n=1 Tax=Mixophyes fleayi TaxID=3061075 RepID=UPI003F4DEF0B
MSFIMFLAAMSLIELRISGAAVRSFVTFTPNWENVFQGDSVTISCNVRSNVQFSTYSFYWYKNNEMMSINEQKFIITSAEENDSGDYQCWTGTGNPSYPARLYVHSKGSAFRPVVTFTPNWRKIFINETVVMRCDVESTAQGTQRYYWYKNMEMINKEQKLDLTIIIATKEDTGDYQCSYGTGSLSYPIRLNVNPYAPVILQAPPYIYEGDPFTLRCHSWSLYKYEIVTFFLTDNKYTQAEKHVLYIPNANTAMTGIYQCTKRLDKSLSSYRTEKDETFILIQELFSDPEIRHNGSSVGGDLTLTCVTRLNPVKATLGLQFAFYRNLWMLQDFSVSDTYRVPSAQLEDSGNYTCDVRTYGCSVRKTSNMLSIQIEELFSYPEIKMDLDTIHEGDDMTLTCGTTLTPLRDTTELEFAFYRDGRNVQEFSVSDTYRVPSAQLEDSGNYTCDVRTSTDSVRKRSNVLYIQIHIKHVVYFPLLELFSYPEIKMDLDTIYEGDNMTLTCDTTRAPLRDTTELEFAFYRDGRNVQEFSVSDTYRVPSAQLEDSGNYTCVVRTITGRHESQQAAIKDIAPLMREV